MNGEVSVDLVVGEAGDETYCKSGVRLQTMLAVMMMRMRESLEVVGVG